jgi:predicted enzyme related to lactoylglutathione lyase
MLKVIEISFCCYAVTEVAMICDPEGNTFGIHKRNAK